jgi:hypothetical protein
MVATRRFRARLGHETLAGSFRDRFTLESLGWPPGSAHKRRATKPTKTETMATSRTAKKPPMQSFARLIARPGRYRETVFDLPSRAVCVGDPWADFAGRVELGVASVAMFFLDVGFGEDNVAIVVRARQSVAVRWELGASGGVDSGVFGVWDADARMTDSDDPGDDPVGACVIGGRRVFALETGDGGFPCVVGFDEKGEVCAVVAGPGVDPGRFGAALREEHMTEEERAEKAAKEARDARLRATDLLGAKLGEERASASLRWFVAGWLDSLPEAERAAVCQKLEPALEALALPGSVKKARARAKADTAAILAWAVSGWATVLAATLPAEAALLSVTGSIERKKMDWAIVLERVYNYKMTDCRFDVTRPYETQLTHEQWEAWSRDRPDREPARTTARRDVPPDLSSRFGLSGLGAMVEKTKPHRLLDNALWYASRGLAEALALHIFAIRAADLARVDNGAPEGGTLLRPRDPGYVEDLLGKVEKPLDLLLRLARRAWSNKAAARRDGLAL